MTTVILCVLLAGAVLLGIKSVKKRLVSGCCTGSSGPAPKKRKVKDRDLSHYPFGARLWIDGMSCCSCVIRVENSLNRLEGVWAQADLSTGEVLVRMKVRLPAEELKAAVREAGYTVYRIAEKNSQ